MSCSHAFSESKLNCFIRRLKSVGKLHSNFSSVGDGSTDEDCEDFIKSFNEQIYNSLNRSLTEYINENVECIVNTAKSLHWADTVTREVIHVSTKALRDGNSGETEEIKKDFENTLTNSMKMCSYVKHFGGIFDREICRPPTVRDNESQAIDYCLKKYVTDRNLIDNSEYQIDLSPISDISCDKTYKDLENNLIWRLNSEKWRDDRDACTSGKHLEAQITDKVAVILVLCQQNISATQKTSQRESFINFMSNVASLKFVCNLSV